MKFFLVLPFLLHLTFSDRTCKVNIDRGFVMNIHGERFRGVPISDNCFTTLLEECGARNEQFQVQVHTAWNVVENVANAIANRTSLAGPFVYRSDVVDTEWNLRSRTLTVTWKNDNTPLCGICNNFNPKNATEFKSCHN